MVFSSASVPVYLDPNTWQQQSGGNTENSQLPLPVPPPPPVGGGGTGTVRPSSMTERARLAKFPQPEMALKCPRCESTNTKFCYFNNYSLSQPRHFCKTCRRYWTRGGALRNVPVGGGFRRNKRGKGGKSKSPVTDGSSSAGGASSNSCTTDIIGHLPPAPIQLPFFPTLHNLSDYTAEEIGLTFGEIHPPAASLGGINGAREMEFHIGSNSSGGGTILSSRFADEWRLQQLQQLPGGIYEFESEGIEPPSYMGVATTQSESKPLETGAGQFAALKLEQNQGLSLSRNFLGIPVNDQYWGGNAWTDLSGFTSSSTSHLL